MINISLRSDFVRSENKSFCRWTRIFQFGSFYGTIQNYYFKGIDKSFEFH